MSDDGKRHVWTGYNVTVEVTRMDDVNYPANPTVLTNYCFFESISINANNELTRRPCTGRTKRKIIPAEFEYSCEVGAMYYRKTEHFNSDMLNRSIALRFRMICIDEFSSQNNTAEPHVLGNAFVSNLGLQVSISEGNNSSDIIKTSMSMEAEDFE